MNAVDMPGFTAESSLYETRGYYRSQATKSYSSVEQGIVPQFRTHVGCGCSPTHCCCIICIGNRCVLACAGPASVTTRM